MKLLYFRIINPKCTEHTELVVLCDDAFERETIREQKADGYKLHASADVLMVTGSESDLPTDRPLTEG